jgi:hypothetical protein
MADDAQMVQGWQQTVDAAHQELQDTANTVGNGIADAAGKRLADAATGADQVTPMQANIFGRAKPNDADLNDQRLHAQESQRAHDQLGATGKVPENVPPPRNSSAWDTYKRKNNLAP